MGRSATGAGKCSSESTETAFNWKGNEEQAVFNAKLDEKVAKAEAELPGAGPSTTPAVQRAMDALKEGQRLLTERQKLIKIADHSEYGWGVVAEYTTDELAEDSDDEKWIEKAGKAAEQKAAKRRKKKLLAVRRVDPVISLSPLHP